MATFVQLEEGHFNNGLLPPLRELFLEIQVNKLIHEYLFSSNADEMCVSLHDESSECKANKPPDGFYGTDTGLQSACKAASVMSIEPLDDHHKQNSDDPHHMQMQTSQASVAHHSITCIEDNGINGKEQMVAGNALETANTVCEANLATLSVESGGKLMHKTAHLSRLDTFPCTSKVQLHVGMPSKSNSEIKVSCKKPPRPPKLPKSELSSGLTRCCSDNGAYLQSSRRTKLDRRRKTATTSSINTSTWALLLTFCFAIIMIAQGFLSQDNQNVTTNGSDAFSPMETFMRASTKGSLDEASGAGAAEREARMEKVLTERKDSTDGNLAQSYVIRKVQSQHLSDMKHLKLDAFPKS